MLLLIVPAASVVHALPPGCVSGQSLTAPTARGWPKCEWDGDADMWVPPACCGQTWGGALFPVYYEGCDAYLPGRDPNPPRPGCPSKGVATFTASFTVPPAPEKIRDQILYFGIRVEYTDMSGTYNDNFISAGLEWNNNCSEPKWTASSCAGGLFCDHNSPLLDVSPGDVVGASITRTATGYTGTLSAAGRQSTLNYAMPTRPSWTKPILASQHDYLDPLW